MAKESTQRTLQRVRAPRVQIAYDVETEGAVEKKELPFVVAVTSDLSGKPDEKRLRDRKFIQVDRDNLDDVMKGMNPRLTLEAGNKLKNDDSKLLPVELKFNKLEDFEPQNVAKQVEPLRKLMDIRRQLSDLLSKTDSNDQLAEKLSEIIGNTELMNQIAKEGKSGEEAEDPDKAPKGEGR